MKKQHRISSVAFETLHAAALAFGGIGAGRYAEGYGSGSVGENAPVCLVGFGRYVDVPELKTVFGTPEGNSVFASSVRPTIEASDNIVRRINQRKGKTGEALDSRVSFKEYVAEAGFIVDPALDAQYYAADGS